ncbi:peptidase M23-like protein [Herbihabitans rhizosphaerae]|uniref:Peptidase M23-like protein n=2 Tax=Herbihabitans rhizosphaerae TaxID=1872711 RepID=A0A4Q7KID7_9PSEU|nr:peptidase M23-like protein [Herbihabitans rhizosphaerae]
MLILLIVAAWPFAEALSASERAGQPPPRSSFVWPAPDPHPVLRPFEPPQTPFGPGHRGVDIGGLANAPVYSAGDGIVAFAGLVAGRTVVSIQHDGGMKTTYEPITPGVAIGQAVRRGEVIGHLQPGHPECPEPVCLHWGAIQGEEYLDPLTLLDGQGAGRVRLLPLRAEG